MEIDISAMQIQISSLNDNMKDVKLRLSAVENDVSGIKQEVSGIKQEVSDVKQEVVKTNISIENRLWPAIQIMKEGFNGQVDKLNDVKKSVESMEPTVLALDIMHIQEALLKAK